MRLDEERITGLHREAMRLAHEAAETSDAGRARQLFLQAFEKEREAAGLLATALGTEPTRAVLHRSAASLGLSARQLTQAYETLVDGLASRSAEIEPELRELKDELDGHLAGRRNAVRARQHLASTWNPWSWQHRIPEILATYLGKMDHLLETRGFSTEESKEIVLLALDRLQAGSSWLASLEDLDLALFEHLEALCRERR